VKRSNEFAVGLAVLAALALVIGGALWLSETDVNQKQASYKARFRTVGGLGVGAPVTLRGVKVGRVESIRLVENEWVETDFSIDRSVDLPRKPAAISASASLFGEWSANIVPFEPLPPDPLIRNALIESDKAGGEAWPGATLPDIGQLTAQASRIAGDVGDITQRIGQAFDSTALKNMQQSVKDLAAISGRLVSFANAQTDRMDRVGQNVATTSDAFAGVAVFVAVGMPGLIRSMTAPTCRAHQRVQTDGDDHDSGDQQPRAHAFADVALVAAAQRAPH